MTENPNLLSMKMENILSTKNDIQLPAYEQGYLNIVPYRYVWRIYGVFMTKRILTTSFLIVLLFSSFGYADLKEDLFSAIIMNNTESAKRILINNPGLLNILDKSGRTPLRWASQKENKELVSWLIKQGAKTDIIYASETGDLNKVKELVNTDKLLLNYKDGIGKTPLHWATLYGHTDMVKYLVTKGADVNSKDNKQNSVLHHAISVLGPDDKSEILNILMKSGIELNPQNIEGRTPLHRAIQLLPSKGALHKIRILLENGADMNISSNRLSTPLCHAVVYSRTKYIQLLIDYAVDVNHKCKNDKTPLHIAIEQSLSGNDSWDDKIVTILMQGGADISIKNIEGISPLQLAEDHDYLLKMIQQ